MHQRLSSSEINTRLQELDNWTLDAHKTSLNKEWEFDSFKTAMGFFVHVGELAEAHNHHPELLFSYTQMRIHLTTHDAYGLTCKDFELAMQIDQLIIQKFSNLLMER